MGDFATYIDTAFWVSSGAILILLIISGFFSGSETALTASSRGKLKAQADKGARGAQTALTLTEDSERLIGAILLGNNMVNILAASIATALFTRLFGDSGVALATLVMTMLVLVFAEVMPKTYAISAPESAAIRVAPACAGWLRCFRLLWRWFALWCAACWRSLGSRLIPTAISCPCMKRLRALWRWGIRQGRSRKNTVTA
jgi:Mg2+/Co2+ transporter CorB